LTTFVRESEDDQALFSRSTIISEVIDLDGRRDDVVAWLEGALKNLKRENPYLHSYARFWFVLDSLRDDPRFKKLLRDTLPPYAKPFDEPAAKTAPPPEPGR
jgi:hypothetical protein